MKPAPYLLRPDRLRTIEKPFAWLPCRMLINGLFANLSDDAKLLYLFLCLAADRQGTSFYGDQRILSYFQRQSTDIDRARKELIQKDLIAYDGHLYQVLSLPIPQSTPTIPTRRTSEPERVSDILNRLASLSR